MPERNDPSLLAKLVDDVLTSSKYRDICPDLVSTIAAQELSKRRTPKEALKATRSKLHQIGGAYLDGHEDYTAWLVALQGAMQVGDEEVLKGVCRQIMGHHASTRERLPILEEFYTTLFAALPPIHSLLDIACGLNPLAIPWMSLPVEADYYAYDIYRQMTGFLSSCCCCCFNRSLASAPVRLYAEAHDVIQSCPTQRADVALVLKTLPCLEQVEKQAGYRLLRNLNVSYLVVSFPIHSLGGRSKGMAAYYETHFHDLIGDEPWEVKKYTFATELVFIVKKDVRG